ncbi:MAG: hypothetical protein ACEPOW_00080 [Bacteroidales bacterium]
MKKVCVLLCALLFSLSGRSQTITFQAGPAISHIDMMLDVSGYQYKVRSETFVGFSAFLGVDYLEKKYFHLSSNLGYIQKGGEYNEFPEELSFFIQFLPGYDFQGMKGILDYVSVNTLVNLKYPIAGKVTPYISFGPRVDYLFDFNDLFVKYEEINEIGKLSYGLLLGGGVKYRYNRMSFGVRSDYYLNFVKVADEKIDYEELEKLGLEARISVEDKVYSLQFSIGYHF